MLALELKLELWYHTYFPNTLPLLRYYSKDLVNILNHRYMFPNSPWYPLVLALLLGSGLPRLVYQRSILFHWDNHTFLYSSPLPYNQN